MSEAKKRYIRGFWKIDRGIAKVLKIISFFPAFVMFIVAVMCTVNVILTKAFNIVFPSMNDYVKYFFVCVVYMSVCHVQFETDFIYVDILTRKFSAAVNGVIGAMGDLLGVVTFAYVSRRMWFLFVEHLTYNKQSSTAIGHIPTWPFVLVFCVFAAILSFTFLRNILRRFIYHGSKRFDEDVLREAGVPELSIAAARPASTDEETAKATEEEYRKSQLNSGKEE